MRSAGPAGRYTLFYAAGARAAPFRRFSIDALLRLHGRMGLIRVTPFFAGSKVIAMSTEWGVAPFMTECSEQPVIDDAISKKVAMRGTTTAGTVMSLGFGSSFG